MTARDDLAAHLAPLLRGAFLLDSDAQALSGARALVDRLTYVIDDHVDIENTSLGAAERHVIRHRWIVVKIPNGVEHHALPYDEGDQPS